MFIIGLTGGIASGKTSVAGFLRNNGAEIIDADIIAKKLVEPGEEAWLEIKEYFGEEVIGENGWLIRDKLAALVFENPNELKKLNSIVHPLVTKKTQEELERFLQEGKNIVVVDAPLLLEAGLDTLVDEVWLVKVSQEEQINRCCERDGLSPEEVEKRINSQMPLAEKEKKAHRIIDNQGSFAETERMILNYLIELGYLNQQR